MRQKGPPRKSLFVFLIFCSFFILILYSPLLAGKNQLFWRDIAILYQPLFDHVRHSFQNGSFPLWTPLIGMGLPLVASAEPALFYPGNFLFWLWDYQQALPWLLSAHHLWAGLGTWLLCRRMGLHPLAASLAGCSFSLSGVMISMNNLSPLMFTAAWIPWLFWSLLAALDSPRHKNWHVALIYAVQILSGHLELVYISSLWLLSYLVQLKCQKKLSWSQMTHLASLALIGVGITGIQMLPSLEILETSVRTLDIFKEYSQQWSAQPLSLPALFIPDFYGNLFYTFHPGSLFGDKNFNHELLFVSNYVGIATVSLAVLGLIQNHQMPAEQKKQFYFWSMSLCIFLLLVSGKHLPFYAWALKLLPGFSFFRYPVKFYIFISLNLSIMGAFSLNMVIDQRISLRAWLYTLVGFGLSCLVISLILYSSYQQLSLWLWQRFENELKNGNVYTSPVLANILQYQASQWMKAVVICVIFGLLIWLWHQEIISSSLAEKLLLICVCVELIMSGVNTLWYVERSLITRASSESVLARQLIKLNMHQHNNARYLTGQSMTDPTMPLSILPELKYSQILRSSIFGYHRLVDNLGLNYNFHNAAAYHPGETKAQDKIAGHYYHQDKYNLPLRNQLETLMAVKYITTSLREDNPLIQKLKHQPRRYTRIFQDPRTELSLWENKNWQSRVHFKSDAYVVPDNTSAWNVLLDFQKNGYSPQKHVILEKDSALIRAQQQVPTYRARQLKISPPQITAASNNRIQIKFKSNNSGYLVLADQYYPGWKVHDNGQDTPLLRANAFQRAVRTGPGEHVVEFYFDPLSFRVGGLISLLSLLLLSGWVLWERKRDSAARQTPFEPIMSA